MIEHLKTESETKVAKLNEPAYHGLLHKIDKLNRRAYRLGVPPVVVTQLSPWVVQTTECGDEVHNLRWADFEISMDVPRLPGWRFLATIEHLDGGNVVRKTPSTGDEVDLSEYREGPARCDHCNKIRRRKDSYIVEHDSGARKQVGKDCLCDVIGLGLTPEAILGHAEWMTSLADLIFSLHSGGDGDGDYFDCGPRVPEHYYVTSFLSICAALIRVDGYRSRKVAREDSGQTATADDALFHIHPPYSMSMKEKRRLEERYGSFPIDPTEDDRKVAAMAIFWAQNLEGQSDFDHNLRLIAGQETIGLRDTGIAAYIIRGYTRTLEIEAERKAKAAARPESRHVGEIGKRIRKATLVFIGTPFSTETEFGPLFIHRFTTEDGAELVWKTSTGLDLEPGSRHLVSFTPKIHDDFKGRPQTVVSRLKFEA